MIEQFAKEYVNIYYEDDDSVRKDIQVINWWRDLETYIPNGISKYAKDISKKSLVDLLAAFMYTASVEHVNVAKIPYNYTVWHQYIPKQIRLDGKRSSIGMHQLYMNTEIGALLNTTTLVDDYRLISLDQNASDCMERFRQNMASYKEAIDQEPFHYYTLNPGKITISTNS
jgi:hypothetical protein